MNEAAVQLKQVSFRYPGSAAGALTQLDLAITPGESVALVGANGAGKSTLLLLLGGLIFPSQGSIEIFGLPVSKANLAAVRRRLGFTFQNPADQLFMPTVWEDVAFAPRNYGLRGRELEERVEAVLTQARALSLAQRHPYQLSGGEQRLAAIATAISMQPEILIMDEPSDALDPKARRHLLELLARLPQTKIIATHDLDMALALCPRTVVLQEGRCLADGPSRQLLSDPVFLDGAGLELPLSLQGCPICGGQPQPMQ